MGLPAITTDTPGCRDVVKDRLTGYLCKARDADSLTDAMRQILRNSPSERKTMGMAARALVEEHYDEKLVVDATLAAIDSAIIGTRLERKAQPGESADQARP